MRPQRSTVSAAIRATSSSAETSTVSPTPPSNAAAASSAPLRSAITIRAPSPRELLGDRAPDPLRRRR